MPPVVIHGMPSGVTNAENLRNLVLCELPEVVASVPEMGLVPDQVTVWVPNDLVRSESRGVVVVFVEGLFHKEERTYEVKARLVEVIKVCLVKFFQANLTECKRIRALEVYPRSQRSGEPGEPGEPFAHWDRDKDGYDITC